MKFIKAASLLAAWRDGGLPREALLHATDDMIALLTGPKPSPTGEPETTAAMGDAALRRHYAKIAPVEDVRFFLRITTNPRLRAEAEELLSALLSGRHPRSETKTSYVLLHQHWRESVCSWRRRIKSAA